MSAGLDKAKRRVKKLCDKVMARDNREVEEEIEKEVSVEKVTTETIIRYFFTCISFSFGHFERESESRRLKIQ